MNETKGPSTGGSGLPGTDYQIKLYMLFLLHGYLRDKNFCLSGEEQERAGKFDDLVFQEGVEILLMQAKHRDNKLLSSHSVFANTGKYSFLKYFDSYKQLKLDAVLTPTCIICINSDVNIDLSNFLNKIPIEQTHLFHNLVNNTEQLLYSFKPDETWKKLKVIKSELQKEEVYEFLKNFRIIVIKDSSIEKSIENMLHQCLPADMQLDIKSAYYFIIDKLKSWFLKKPKPLEKIHLDAFFSEMISANFFKRMGLNYDKISFTDVRPPPPKQVVMIQTSKHLIVTVKLYLQFMNEKNRHILFVNSNFNSFQREMINAFQLSYFTHLICRISKKNYKSITESMEDLLSKIGEHEYKHIIILVDSNLPLNCSQKIEYLSDSDFYKNLNINEHFRKKFNTAQDVYYIERTYVKNTEVNNVFAEDDFLNLVLQNDKKIFIIKDIPGMGKSTVLSNLTNKINQNCNDRLAIKFDLNNFTHLFQSLINERQLEIDDFFDIDSTFDRQILLLPNVLVLLFDGLDEISSKYIDFFLQFIRNNYNNIRINTIIISTRPHVYQLTEKEHFFKSADIFHLQPLLRKEQHNFISDYWTKKLHLKKSRQKRKCIKFGKLLIKKLSSAIADAEALVGIPLQLRMLSEIFQEQAKQYSCKQVNKNGNDYIQIDKKWNISKLYDMFIERQSHIFIEDKGCAQGNKYATYALKKLFQTFLDLFCNLALTIIFPTDISDKYQKCVEESLEDENFVSLCDIGLVIQTRRNVKFLHRTFAEYLIAKRLFKKACDAQAEDITYLIQNVFNNENYKAISIFFDGILDLEWDKLNENMFSVFGNTIKNMFLDNKKLVLYRLTEHKCKSIIKLLLEKCDIVTDILNSLDAIFSISEKEVPVSKHSNFSYVTCENISIIGKENKSSLLHYSVYIGCLKIIKYLIEKGADIQIKTSFNISVLHIAVDRDNFSIIKFLIKEGANIHAVSRSKSTALHFAAFNGNLDLTKYLIENGSDLYARNGTGETVLHRAALGRNVKLVEYLIDEGVDMHAITEHQVNALHNAIQDNNFEIAEYLVEKGADVNAEMPKGIPLIHIAVQIKSFKIIKLLIENGADCTDKRGSTILSEAVRTGCTENVKYLVEKGLHLRDSQMDDMLLRKATSGGWLEIVKYFIEKGVHFNIKSPSKVEKMKLYDIAREGWEKVVVHYIEQGPNLSPAQLEKDAEKNKIRYTIPERVISTGWLGIIHYLLEQSASSHIKSEIEVAVLHKAAAEGHVVIVRYLIDKGVNVNAKSTNEETVLHKAAATGWLKVVRYLIQKGANLHAKNDFEETALHKAACCGDLDIVKYLVDKGADVHTKNKIGETVLHKAVSKRKFEVVKYLIERGADLHIKNKFEETVLHKAAACGGLDIMKYLLEQAPATYTKIKFGKTILFNAVIDMWFVTTKYLRGYIHLGLGVDLDTKNKLGETVLHKAAYCGDLDIVKYLIEQGSDVHIQNNFGDTVLHKVSSKGWLEAVQFLIQEGANIHTENEMGATVLHKAAAEGHFGIVQYLAEQGASLHAKTKYGDTVLHKAAFRGCLDTVKYATERGADLNLPNEDGVTALAALYKAVANGRFDIAQYLLNLDKTRKTVVFL